MRSVRRERKHALAEWTNTSHTTVSSFLPMSKTHRTKQTCYTTLGNYGYLRTSHFLLDAKQTYPWCGGIFRDRGRTVLLSSDCCMELPELACKEDEVADTRMFARVAYSMQHLHHTKAANFCLKHYTIRLIRCSLIAVGLLCQSPTIWLCFLGIICHISQR